MKTLLLFIALAGFTFAQEPAPKDWEAWAKWAEKLHPITDAQGHGPDIGSDEWRLSVASATLPVGQQLTPSDPLESRHSTSPTH